MRTLPFLLALAALAFWPTRRVVAQDEPTLRVQLLAADTPDEVTLQGEGGPLALYLGDEQALLTRLDEGEPVVLRRERDEVRVDLPDGALYALSVRAVPEQAFALQTGTSNERWPYAGTATVSADAESAGLNIINHIALEDYVASVIGSEYGLPDVEGTKAMAVAIRTYALRSGGKFGEEVDHVDNVLSQHYRGLRYANDTTRTAARETRGEVLTHDGELIEAVYFSSSGGHTANNEDVWAGRRLPYLRGRDDPFDAISPHRSWRSSVDRGRLLSILSREAGRPVRGFLLGDRSTDGRVMAIELLHDGHRSEMQANRFRLLVNRAFGIHTLKSALFTAARRGDRYVFEGSGYGHGVGMSQWGAHGMARRGHDYRDILAFYYKDVAIKQLDGSRSVALTPPPIASEPASTPPPLQTDTLAAAASDTARAEPADTTLAAEVPVPAHPTRRTSPPKRRIGW